MQISPGLSGFIGQILGKHITSSLTLHLPLKDPMISPFVYFHDGRIIPPSEEKISLQYLRLEMLHVYIY